MTIIDCVNQTNSKTKKKKIDELFQYLITPMPEIIKGNLDSLIALQLIFKLQAVQQIAHTTMKEYLGSISNTLTIALRHSIKQ